ncbi:PREDICTED: uncharacterized protein LOC106103906 [Papilio polytes]|uniref:uncharacterized protein LOC106103906 n=1 Tax=Papilio polytes TaxID=76194 RepID=UPI0006768D71|nr:PREDICTED: uncharacterized protein LOC106103906 [Papilio polytes]
MRNIEIKAKVHNVEEICKKAAELSGSSCIIIKQDDVFYKVNDGRLKMRKFPNSAAVLVRYSRDDEEGPKLSNYDLLEFSPVESKKAEQLDNILQKCLGIRGRVIKERKLYLVGQTRIHIDNVKGLGNFMELEVVLKPDQSVEEGEAIAKDLQNKLGVKNEDLIKGAYMDLLEKL